jgi:hypothetical protein
MTLTILALLAFVFVIVFTYKTYHAGSHPRAAIIEAWTNMAIGFGINFTANLMILPLIGVNVTASENFAIGWLYTAVSVLRQYAIRRWFQTRIREIAERL